MKNRLTLGYLFIAIILASCSDSSNKSDGYGTFESTETTISSEVQGRILSLPIEEGQTIEKGIVVATVDSTQTYLKLLQLEAQVEAINSKKQTIAAQSNVYAQQLENIDKDVRRTQELFNQSAATQKQMDDVTGQAKVIQAQKRALEAQLSDISIEARALTMQVMMLKDQLAKCRIVNPVTGTVLVKYAESGEIVAPGKGIYKIADLEEINLKVYISGKQLSDVHLGDSVTVITDVPEGLKEQPGVISWVSSEAEFTPKIVQTREERVKLVYAVKIRVKNDGSLKIGMPGEMRVRRNK